jgi:transposase
MDRTMLRDDQWVRIEQLLPGKKSDPGRTAKDNRRSVEAVLWIMRTSSPWCDLPEELGHWHRTYVRFLALARERCLGAHGAVDALGNPLRVILSAGQIVDIEQATALIEGQPAEFVVADKGYDSDALVAAITEQGSQAVIPPRSNRLTPRWFDRHIYKSRNLIERFFGRIKQFRRIATRYDKLASSFLPFVHLACTIVWLA